MNRILKRPMFRMGGSSGTGITSGLDKPRAQYSNGTTLEQLQKATGAVPNNRNLSQFLTTFGLDLLSRPPSGGFFSTVHRLHNNRHKHCLIILIVKEIYRDNLP